MSRAELVLIVVLGMLIGWGLSWLHDENTDRRTMRLIQKAYEDHERKARP